MSYIPFARKYRPQDFDEIAGQEHIVTTLKNAILQNRIANAYLFAGFRGTGKTSTARIFAKALNCEKGPTVSPCNKCIACDEITKGASLDVIEIDGASNRGIEEARTIRENVRFSPSRGRFKIYIIDEVHMLTQEAFNALLKTLEEPPPHVRFFFATTAPNKVIPTILSRCQRFDFRRIGIELIIKRLKLIAKEEKIDIEEGALFTIARTSEGSLRNAESLMDQIVSFTKDKVCETDVAEVLGIIDKDIVFGLADYILHRNPEGLLKRVDSLIQGGCDIMQLNLNLMEHFRNLIICKFEKELEQLIEMPQEHIEQLKAQSKGMTLEDGMFIFQVLSNAQEAMRRLDSTRIQFELALVKLSKRSDIVSLDTLVEKLSEIEKRLETAQPPPSIEQEPKEPQKTDSISDPVHNCKKLTVEMVKEAWPMLIDAIGRERMSVASYLSEGEPTGFDGENILVGIPKEFTLHKETLEEIKNKGAIEKTLQELLGEAKVSVKFVTVERPTNNTRAQESTPNGRVLDTKDPPFPIVESALKIFDAKFTRKPHRAVD